MPLLAIELVGIYSIVSAEKEKINLYYLFSGMWMGIGFLVKGFMIFAYTGNYFYCLGAEVSAFFKIVFGGFYYWLDSSDHMDCFIGS